MNQSFRGGVLALILGCLVTLTARADKPTPDDQPSPRPVPLVFDTDMGNDVDDALALGVIHALESRGECRLLAVTVSKDNPYSAIYCDLVNHFYGRGTIPVGAVRDGKTFEDGKFVRAIVEAADDGRPRYPRGMSVGDEAPEAVALLRRVLAEEADESVVLVVVGFSTNMARLVDSPPDEFSPLSGRELVARKCRLLSIMAGNYGAGERKPEYNVHVDLAAARRVYEAWPTPIVASGFEIGLAITYPAESILADYHYVRHHPLSEAYALYLPMPYDRPTWDLTSVLYAVRPDRGYFGLSPSGTITVGDDALTHHAPSSDGQHRYLTVTAEQIVRVREALVQLASQPPCTGGE